MTLPSKSLILRLFQITLQGCSRSDWLHLVHGITPVTSLRLQRDYFFFFHLYLDAVKRLTPCIIRSPFLMLERLPWSPGLHMIIRTFTWSHALSHDHWDIPTVTWPETVVRFRIVSWLHTTCLIAMVMTHHDTWWLRYIHDSLWLVTEMYIKFGRLGVLGSPELKPLLIHPYPSPFPKTLKSRPSLIQRQRDW
jgi:hypothetical protein